MRANVIFTLALSVMAAAAMTQDPRAQLKRSLTELWTEQRYEELLKTVQPHLVDRPEAAELWMMAAEAALKAEDHARAIECFEKSVALSPGLKGAAINLGFAYLKADRPDDAEKVFQPFLKESNKPRAAKAHYGLGLVMAARGETAKAKAAFEAAAAMNPDDVRPHYRLGQIALQAGDWENAVLLLSLVLSKDDLHHGAAYGLARAYAGLGRKDDADRAAEAHRKILDVSDALPGMIRKLADAKDPVAARLAIRDRLLLVGARKAATLWSQRAKAFETSTSRPESRD